MVTVPWYSTTDETKCSVAQAVVAHHDSAIIARIDHTNGVAFGVVQMEFFPAGAPKACLQVSEVNADAVVIANTRDAFAAILF